jgi:hypothetical protein
MRSRSWATAGRQGGAGVLENTSTRPASGVAWAPSPHGGRALASAKAKPRTDPNDLRPFFNRLGEMILTS